MGLDNGCSNLWNLRTGMMGYRTRYGVQECVRSILLNDNWFSVSLTTADQQVLQSNGRLIVDTGNIKSIVVYHLQKIFKGDNVAVACIYCNYKEQIEQTVSNLVASLLKQIVQDRYGASDNVKSLYELHNHQSTRPTLDELTTALKSEIGAYSKVFIVIDALDEYPEDNGIRLNLLKALRSLVGTVNLMVTSRDLSSIA